MLLYFLLNCFRIQNNRPVKSDQVSKWFICALADATEGCGLEPKMVLRKTGPNLNLYTSSGSAIIKKIVEGGGADSLYARRVNKVKDALPLNSDFFPSPTLCFKILEEIVNPLMPGGN